MKKTIKYISVLFLFLLFFNSVCLATDIDMNLESNEVFDDANTTTQFSEIQNPSNFTTVTTSPSTSDDGFNITNIINIFLVVVGIVLILLGFAILVRLKY